VAEFFRAVFGGLRGGSFTYSQARIDRRIRNDLFKSLTSQEIGFFDENKTGTFDICEYSCTTSTYARICKHNVSHMRRELSGELCSRLNADCQTMSNTLSLYMNVLTRNLTMLFGSLIFMFSLSWRLSMVTFIAIPIIFLVSKVYGVYYDVRFSHESSFSFK
jgi:ATP-binding cassette subfamily B (MDR/TAP) protein 9